MGGAVSAGEDNDELVDNLARGNYIKTEAVELALRYVDRGMYVLEQQRQQAYRDMAWKYGNLHLSAPCIYAEVLENLDIKAGMSFLNVGSGTGYLSTIVGILLGGTGSNHGVELHDDVVDYAHERLRHYQAREAGADRFAITWPQFVQGNAFGLDGRYAQTYDRIYCGAGVSEPRCQQFYQLLKVGGVCVHPKDETLVAVTRVSQSAFNRNNVLQVSFATMVEPSDEQKADMDAVILPAIEVPPLKWLAREAIRARVRHACIAAGDGRILPERCLCKQAATNGRCALDDEEMTSDSDGGLVVRRFRNRLTARMRQRMQAAPAVDALEAGPPPADNGDAADDNDNSVGQPGQPTAVPNPAAGDEQDAPDADRAPTGAVVTVGAGRGIAVRFGALRTMRNHMLRFNAVDLHRLAAARTVMRQRRSDLYQRAVQRRVDTNVSMTDALNDELRAADDVRRDGEDDAEAEAALDEAADRGENGMEEDAGDNDDRDVFVAVGDDDNDGDDRDERMEEGRHAGGEEEEQERRRSSPSSSSTELGQPDEDSSSSSSESGGGGGGDDDSADSDGSGERRAAKRARQLSQPTAAEDVDDGVAVSIEREDGSSSHGGGGDSNDSSRRQLDSAEERSEQSLRRRRTAGTGEGAQQAARRTADMEHEWQRIMAEMGVEEGEGERRGERHRREERRRRMHRIKEAKRRQRFCAERTAERWERRHFVAAYGRRLAALDLPPQLAAFVNYGRDAGDNGVGHGDDAPEAGRGEMFEVE